MWVPRATMAARCHKAFLTAMLTLCHSSLSANLPDPPGIKGDPSPRSPYLARQRALSPNVDSSLQMSYALNHSRARF